MRHFDSMNPVAVAVYYLCVTLITMFSQDPVIALLSLSAAIAVCTVTGAAGRREHLFSLLLYIVLAVINPLIVHNGVTVLFYLNDRPITWEATAYGLTAAATLCAALYWLRALSKAMTGDRVLYAIGRLSPGAALLLSMTIRYIGLFKQRWRKIQDSQRALGLYRDGNLIDAVRGRARVLGILITWTLENGIITAESMEARGYGARRRTSFAHYRMHTADAVLIAASALLSLITVIGISRTAVRYYPALSADLRQPYHIISGAAFALLCTIPLIKEGKEAIRWRCLRSKI